LVSIVIQNPKILGGRDTCMLQGEKKKKKKHILKSVSLNTDTPVEPNESFEPKSGKIYKKRVCES
jgi:hypothetical protein